VACFGQYQAHRSYRLDVQKHRLMGEASQPFETDVRRVSGQKTATAR
jgi:hypothetical protein